MLDELAASSDLLCTAIERYSAACIAIRESFERREIPHETSSQLTPRMSTEVQLATSLEVKLRGAKASLNWCRNQAIPHATINSLPPELLSRIFHLVHRSRPCAKRDYASCSMSEPVYPKALSLVCSRWREVIFSLPALWTHIDISTSAPFNQQHLGGIVQLHLSKVGQLPIDLHIFDPPGDDYGLSFKQYGPVRELTAQVASRVISFDLDIEKRFDYHIHYNILETFIRSCAPGQLARITLSQNSEGGHELLNSDFGIPDAEDESFSLRRFEEILLHVSVLRLSRLFPSWSSRAYHGLVELRIVHGRFPVPESDFTNMLRCSPDLRILQFNLIIINSLPVYYRPTPIPLINLEVLNLSKLNYYELSTLLRWIAPGPKPLQFAAAAQIGPRFTEENIKLFFLRSCITRVYVANSPFFHILELLTLLPDIQELVLHGTFLDAGQDDLNEAVRSIPQRRLDGFHLATCGVDTTILGLMSNSPLGIRLFTFHGCHFYHNGAYIPDGGVASHIKELGKKYPSVKFTIKASEGPGSVKSWNLFASHEMPWAG
ncbi:hypothetical protein RHS03_06733, partial [Rhizoctonia solani]